MDNSNLNNDFSKLDLAAPVAQAVQELGYEIPTAIQSQCIPHLLAGRDVLGQAQTGTGKTAAFALPILSQIDFNLSPPQILVLTPTRELALQVAEAFQLYARHLTGFHVLPIYGGQSYELQLGQLKRHPQVIIGTPGRVMDHIRRNTLNLNSIRTIVLDEADEMLNMGFAEDIDWIFQRIPSERQVALFSATMPPAIRKVAQDHLNNPIEVRITSDSETVATVNQYYCLVTRYHKLDVLTRILELEPFAGILIFVRTKNATTELADRLKAHGFTAEPLNGDMNQELRERTMDRLKQGQLDILVATDVAARGLDIERLSHVINYDIPTDSAAYVHRIGRTGRAGRAGKAISLVEPRERGLLRSIERAIRCNIIGMEPPSAAALSESRIDRFVAELQKTCIEQDLDFFYRLLERISQEQEIEMINIAAALVYLYQRERPLNIKEELPRPASRREQFEHVKSLKEHKYHRDHTKKLHYSEEHRESFNKHRPDNHHFEKYKPKDTYSHHQNNSDKNESYNLTSYRIEIGHYHGVTPREIVGAIANESGLEGRYIGRIEIQENHTIVHLPKRIPPETFQRLKRIFIRGQALHISNYEAKHLDYQNPHSSQKESLVNEKKFSKFKNNQNLSYKNNLHHKTLK